MIGSKQTPIIRKRRNSELRIEADAANPCVEKTYHARFTVDEEQRAYLALDELLALTNGVRRPHIYSIDRSRNSIRLEYVQGPTLLEDFLQRGVTALDTHREVLIALFVGARRARVPFDSDPANFIVSNRSPGLVLLDPTCGEVDLPDFAAVVFLWGLIKAMLRGRRWWQFRAFRRSWIGFYAAYLGAADVRYQDLNLQMCRYIDSVISWNLQESHAEPYWLRVARTFLVVPTWRSIRLCFKWNVVRA